MFFAAHTEFYSVINSATNIRILHGRGEPTGEFRHTVMPCSLLGMQSHIS